VPVVLIKISETESVITPRPRSGMRAFLPVSATAVLAKAAFAKAAPAQAGPSASARALSTRPSVNDLPAAARKQQHGTHVLTDWAVLPLTGQASYMTRISATGDGASGPHPAREPEPV
jgi:hypothetical protein